MKLYRLAWISVIICGCRIRAGPGAPAEPRPCAPAVAARRYQPRPTGLCSPGADCAQRAGHDKSSFTLDRSMLNAAAGLMGDTDAGDQQAIAKLDWRQRPSAAVWRRQSRRPGTGGRHSPGLPPARLEACDHGCSRKRRPIVDGKTDVWLVLDGVNMRGAVVLVDSPKALTLVYRGRQSKPEDSAPSARTLRDTEVGWGRAGEHEKGQQVQ